MDATRLTFASDGIDLVGHLRVPDDAVSPAVVLTGPFTGVKEQVTGVYARRLTEQGFATLAFDHRNFGESGGVPRQHEDAGGKLADLRDALSELAVHPRVDASRLAVVGICLGGGYALRFAATDPRVAALRRRGRLLQRPGRLPRRHGGRGLPRHVAGLAEVATEERRTVRSPTWRPSLRAGRPRCRGRSPTSTTARSGLRRRTGRTGSPVARSTRC
jgi:uncharacterized protein